MDWRQKSAIELGQELAYEITNSQKLSEYFLEQISLNNKKYADIIKDVLCVYPKINILNKNTLRSVAQNVLKQLLSDEERQKVITNAKKRGGHLAISGLQVKNGVDPLSDDERGIMNNIGKNSTGYKKNTVRNIVLIQKVIYAKTGVSRNKGTIKKYMAKFNDIKKAEAISWSEYPEEIKHLKKLYKKYHVEGQKLPISKITEELNRLYNHNRTTDAVSIYIRVNWTSNKEKEARTSKIRSNEEILFIRKILAYKNKYIKRKGRGKGGYNLSQIEKELKRKFPDSNRGIKGIKHQLDKQEKLMGSVLL